MTTITKVSEITAQDVAEYLRLDEVDESELAMLNTMLGVAKQFIIDYTGQTDLDEYQTFVDAVYVLCQDMWDNRTMYVDKLNLNKVVQAILGMHSVNLL